MSDKPEPFQLTIDRFGTFEDIIAKARLTVFTDGRTYEESLPVDPFSRQEVLEAVENKDLEPRHRRHPEVEREFREFLTSHSNDAEAIKEYVRRLHIRRVAYFYACWKDTPEEAITVTKSLDDFSDGMHRLLAAIVRGMNEIWCKTG